jgi:hypothetical protein
MPGVKNRGDLKNHGTLLYSPDPPAKIKFNNNTRNSPGP